MKNLKAVLLTFLICLFTVNVCWADAISGLEQFAIFLSAIIFFIINIISFYLLHLLQSTKNKKSNHINVLFLLLVIPAMFINIYGIYDSIPTNSNLLPVIITLFLFIIAVIIYIWLHIKRIDFDLK